MGKRSGKAGDLAAADALRVFISYSRADIAAAEAIADALARNGFGVKIDVRDLPYGEEWQAELAGFIASSDTVVWLVSPDSVRSRWVNWELGEVVRLSKRLVPVRVSEVHADTLPEALGRINLLPNRGVYHPDAHEQALVATLNTNRAWLRKSTSLAEAAAEWNAAGRDSARLLRGRALKEAEAWAAQPPRDAPAPASATLGLILASRIATPFDAGTEIAAASISADETMVMVTSAKGDIRIFDAATGMPLSSAFDPGVPCHSIEHDARRSMVEIGCDDRALQRILQPAAGNAAGLDAFALESPAASTAFFASIPAFDLGGLASASLDIAVPPMQGTVDEFLKANAQ